MPDAMPDATPAPDPVPDPVQEGRLFAVGDVHGAHAKLARLLERLPVNTATDAVVFLGDYINRGPQSRRVIETLLDFGTRCPGAVFLLGNHEWLLLEYARSGDLDLLATLRAQGVQATLDSYGAPPHALRSLSFLPPDHLDFLERLKPFHRQGGYFFVHAGVSPDKAPEDSPTETLLGIRELFLHEPGELGEPVVFGHTVFETPFVSELRIGIDTGAVYGNLLTAVELPVPPGSGELRFYHA
jgi:serine/threonine protein phosphatase 1